MEWFYCVQLVCVFHCCVSSKFADFKLSRDSIHFVEPYHVVNPCLNHFLCVQLEATVERLKKELSSAKSQASLQEANFKQQLSALKIEQTTKFELVGTASFTMLFVLRIPTFKNSILNYILMIVQ